METVPSVVMSLLRWGASALSSTFLLLPTILLSVLSRRGAQRLLQAWARLQRALFRIDLTVDDRAGAHRPDGACIYVVLNQTSLVESFLLPAFLAPPFRFFANIEFLLLPLVGWATWAAASVAVVRQWPAQRRRALARAAGLVGRGDSFCISIEGARSAEGLLPYKTGPLRLALATGAPIVPVVIHGARERLPVGGWRVRPGPVRIVLLPPIASAGLRAEDLEELAGRLRALAEDELALQPPHLGCRQ